MGAMAATPRTRSGCRAATIRLVHALVHSPTSRAFSTPTASITATVSSARCVNAICAGSWVRSERPLPRGSIATTRAYRDRYGICPFQNRECTIGSIGAKTTVRSPEPYTS